ncbi:hypothetical protein [Pseudomonas fulva]|jgi:hypothetical protein|uniref:hypothetical protein n=1 Tax=Pseudomonas putida group TaxID=136845 RepID=UPI001F441960|nr:hypothetical protein [Pseudomonas fulva]
MEAMFTLCGQVANVYVQPGGLSKKTGEVFDPRDKVQILGQLPLPAGGHKLELVTLNVEDARAFESIQGKTIRVPVGVYAIGKSVGYFIPQGAKPALVQPVS